MSTELVSPSNIESAPFRFEGSVENRVNQFLQILRSEKDVRAVKQLTGLDAQKFLDSAQELLERDGAFPRQQEPELFRKACRLILKVSQITDQLPASLFVSKAAHDVRWLSQGHYSDVYSCEHHDGLDFPGRVILKRLRVFQLDPIAKHDTFKNLCREALVLRRLHHPSVLEFLGIDNKTFLDEEHDYSYSCLIFPLMEKGTLRHFRTVKGPRNIPVMKLVRSGILEKGILNNRFRSWKLSKGSDIFTQNLLFTEI
ncbi:hypothetical protein B0H10DRAFT_578272 [Mycena sp. CBHHK59/15]|nr:hypothetical protein B0H10DRAFT_578272 [Mycena sp. CBHHK59/15]